MGVRGRPKHPTLRVVDGEAVFEQPAGTAAAQVAPGNLTKPVAVQQDSDLNQWWDDVVPGMERAGLVSECDVPAVVGLLQHLVTSHKAFLQVQREGVSVFINENKPEQGTKKNPAEMILRSESDAALRFAIQLGGTWMSRARTDVPKGDADSGNPFGAEAIG